MDAYNIEAVDENSVLFSKGEVSKELFLIKKGSFRVFKEEEGVIYLIGIRKSGSYLGEHSILKKESLRKYSAVAAESSEIIRIPYEDIDKILREGPIWLRQVFGTILSRSQTLNEFLLTHRLYDDIEILEGNALKVIHNSILEYRKSKGLKV
ncbi:MAG: Crp/Fnr family transcriptional regulator [Bdellovibrionales bacterium]|jgi:CRP-like cAMP-binding protein|nr:Crp/Fnr family transcriptional regulator [Bdellovibrionales bacterium]